MFPFFKSFNYIYSTIARFIFNISDRLKCLLVFKNKL